VRRLPQVAALALLGLAGCGSHGGPSRPDDASARQQLQNYLAAFYRGDGRTACSLLTPAGQAGMRSESRRLHRPDCAGAVEEVSSTSRRIHAPQVSVVVNGDRATATVRATHPPYRSGALLEKSDGKWLIVYPPGLLQKYVGKGGVFPHARLQTPSD
jgi:hypothetical protein